MKSSSDAKQHYTSQCSLCLGSPAQRLESDDLQRVATAESADAPERRATALIQHQAHQYVTAQADLISPCDKHVQTLSHCSAERRRFFYTIFAAAAQSSAVFSSYLPIQLHFQIRTNTFEINTDYYISFPRVADLPPKGTEIKTD